MEDIGGDRAFCGGKPSFTVPHLRLQAVATAPRFIVVQSVQRQLDPLGLGQRDIIAEYRPSS